MLTDVSSKLSLGHPSTHGALTLTPILANDGPLLAIETGSLEEALMRGTIKVTEVSAEGHVPELLVKNSGDAPVLILDGEELAGAKQNRIVNLTILVPARSEIVIPVSCIEVGRWAYSRPGFAAAGRVLNQKSRSRKADAVTMHMKNGGARFSDQRAVWDDVSEALYSLNAYSATHALSDGFESRAATIDAYLGAFKPQLAQVGIVYRIGGVLAGLDLFGSHVTFVRAFPKLIRGLALQALVGFEKDGNPPQDDDAFLSAVLRTPADCFPAVGLGEELRLDTEEIGGGALLLDGGLVHLLAFPRTKAAHGDANPRRRPL